jgi:uncharacterized lipoprotein
MFSSIHVGSRLKFSNVVLKTSILSAVLLLASCGTTTPTFIVAPDIQANNVNQYKGQNATLTVSDMRTHQHLVQINKDTLFSGNNAAELLRSQQPIAEAINETLLRLFKQQGLSLNDSKHNVITINVKEAIVSVNQQVMSYEAKNQINLTATVINSEKTLTKTFTSNGSSSGPLTADLAVLERDFNQQLGDLLLSIVNDPEIHSFIK